MQVELIDQPENTQALNSRLSSEQPRLRLKNILVPTDFSEASLKSLNYGVALAQQFNAALWLVNIVEPPPSMSGFEGSPVLASGPDLMANSERLMAEFVAKHVPLGVSVTSLVRDGSAANEISALAKERNIDLVVATTHGRTGLNRALFGSMTERLVHHAPCPILIVREQEHEFIENSPASQTTKAIRLNRLLTPLDFTDCSEKALRYAVAFARQFGAQIFCLHVLPPEKPLLLVELEAFRKTQLIDAEKKMAAHIKEMDGSVQSQSAIRTGTAHEEIIDLADEQQIDLIIVGEHRRSGVERFILGSTTDQVVRRAHCPVLVVREIEHEFIA